MNSYLISSHNSMSYLKPTKWWMKCFNFVAKCQNKTISEQLALGVRNFDIRIDFDDNFNPIFAHGLIKYNYDGNIRNIFYLLNNYNTNVRIILEINKHDKRHDLKCNMFVAYVQAWIRTYPNINFWGGNCKYDWKELVSKLKGKTLEHVQYVGSMNKFWLYKIWPKLYAMRYNKRVIDNLENKITYIDFVGNYY